MAHIIKSAPFTLILLLITHVALAEIKFYPNILGNNLNNHKNPASKHRNNEKPILEVESVDNDSAMLSTIPGAEERSMLGPETKCRGGGSRYAVEIAHQHMPTKFKPYRNVKQTENGLVIGTLKPGRIYFVRARCVFKYNAKFHDGKWSEPIQIMTAVL